MSVGSGKCSCLNRAISLSRTGLPAGGQIQGSLTEDGLRARAQDS